MIDYTSSFVHPDYYRYILQESLKNGLGVGFDDIINSLQLRSPGEFRPRFLAYGIQAIDQKLRLFGYNYVVVHPTVAPIAWFLQLIVAPICLYRLMRNLTLDSAAAWVATTVYLTATGFLSGFTMGLLQGKALVNVALIVALYGTSVVARHLKDGHGQLFYQADTPAKYAVLGVIFLSLFLDELSLFVFVLVPSIFPWIFVPSKLSPVSFAKWAKNAVVFAIPGIAFLAIVIFVVPILTERYFGFRFDYLGNTLVAGENKDGAISIFEGPYAKLSPEIIQQNFTTLFGLSLIPWPISPLITSPYGDYPGGQVNNIPKVAGILAFFLCLGWLASKSETPARRYVWGALGATVLFLLYLSVLLIRHIPVATGFYYGQAFAVMFALLVGLAYGAIPRWRQPARLVGAIVGLAIAVSQVMNFTQINDGWIRTHNEGMARPSFSNDFHLAPPRPVTPGELRTIWGAWREGRLEDYVHDNEISTGAIYLVYELRAIDRFRSPGA